MYSYLIPLMVGSVAGTSWKQDVHQMGMTLSYSSSVSSIMGIQPQSRIEDIESKVLVLYTGGTIGMVRNEQNVLVPKANYMKEHLMGIVTTHDKNYTLKTVKDGEADDYLALPETEGQKRIVYKFEEYETLLDSSNMDLDDWSKIARDIETYYDDFDGFVVLHGTDTMVYTASALSFMLEHLSKPVVITGAQIPCFETRNDGLDNIIGSLVIAGNYKIPEVMIYFHDQLIRGNRAQKMTCDRLDAFHSPNFPALASIGINIKINRRLVWTPSSERLRVKADWEKNVVLLKIFPGISLETVRGYLGPHVKGVVLECFGAGNFPAKAKDILEAMAEAFKNGTIIASVTQCSHGRVTSEYEAGQDLAKAGVIPCADMTPEAAFTKLSYLLSKDDLSFDEKRSLMGISLRGEMTTAEEDSTKVAETPLMTAIRSRKGNETVEALKKCGGDLGMSSLGMTSLSGLSVSSAKQY